MTRDARGDSRIIVDEIESAEPGSDRRSEQRAAEKRRVLYLLLKFKNDPQEPHPVNFYKDLTNPLTPPAGSNTPATINGFFKKTSWNRLQWIAHVGGKQGLDPTQWLVLPKTKNQYAPCGWDDACANIFGLRSDALALAQNAGIDLSVYDNINFVVNNDLDCCAWGGGFSFNGKFYGATYEPPWGQEASIYVHEFGHSIGLPHSGWVYHAYDSPWDEMSNGAPAQSVQCGSYQSANDGNQTTPIICTEPGSGYITPYKNHLGWLPNANKLVIDKVIAKTVTLTANATPLAAGLKMIKVCLAGAPCTGGKAHYLTVEARIRGTQFEDGMPGDGVIIHDFRRNRAPIGSGNDCFFNTQSGWAVPIDATPGDWRGEPHCDSGGRQWPNYGLGNAQFVPGKTYKNNAKGITIKVLQKQGMAYVVKVIRAQ
jgi:hypothetical protein